MTNRKRTKARRALVTVHEDGSGTIVRKTSDTPILVDGAQFDRVWAGVDEHAVPKGEHVWCLFGMWRVDPIKVQNEPAHLDMENLLQVSGPGCYVCEQTWTPEVGALPCPGPAS